MREAGCLVMAPAKLRDNIRGRLIATAGWIESLRRSESTLHHNPRHATISEHRAACHKSSIRPKQRDGSEQRGLISKPTAAELHLAPGRPGILPDIGLHGRQE